MGPVESGAVIRTDELTCAFGALRAVDRLSIQVPAGSLFGFLGPNGSGKTTTIRLLLGLLRPAGGSARVLGLDPASEAHEIRRQAGVLLEHDGIYERLSARENLEFHARVRRLPRPLAAGRIREMLERFGLWDRREEVPVRWSRGMRQKLALARALLHRPPLIFLDEPTAGLDPAASASLRQDLTGLAAQEGVTVFLTTHNLAEAGELCSAVAVIHHGRLVAQGPPDELRRRSRLRITGRGFTSELLERLRAMPQLTRVHLEPGALLLDLGPEAEPSPLVRFLVEGGAAIEEVRKENATMEEVFLHLTRDA